jgi:hypothetical protein
VRDAIANIPPLASKKPTAASIIENSRSSNSTSSNKEPPGQVRGGGGVRLSSRPLEVIEYKTLSLVFLAYFCYYLAESRFPSENRNFFLFYFTFRSNCQFILIFPLTKVVPRYFQFFLHALSSFF